jgi:hypothetical protein
MEAALTQVSLAEELREAEIQALADWYATPEDLYVESRDILGVPTDSQRTLQATADNWYTHHRLVKGPDRKVHAQVVGAIRCVGGRVKVTLADGTSYYRDAESYRGRNEGEAEAVQLAAEGQARKLALLASCGIAADCD